MRHLTLQQMQEGERFTNEELKKMPTPRLFHLFRRIRALADPGFWGWRMRCCEICKEFYGDKEDYQRLVVEPSKPFEDYAKRIKEELNTRSDQFSHRFKDRKNKKPKTVRRQQCRKR